MGFLRSIGNAFIRFMYGRNGMDQLNRALLWAYIAVWVVQMVLSAALESVLVAALLDGLALVLLVAVLFRMFSKDLARRRAENERWTGWVWRMKSRQAGAKARHADKDHKYFTCRNCKTICRVPVGKGKIVITCPKCGAQIQART